MDVFFPNFFKIMNSLILCFIGDDSILWHALLFLEEAVECSQTFAQFKLLLMYIYAKIGKLSVFIFIRHYTQEIDILLFFSILILSFSKNGTYNYIAKGMETC